MALFSALSLASDALRTAGLRAPGVLARYGALTYLNRTSAGRRISKAPRPFHTTAGLQRPGQASAGSCDADIVIPVYNDFDGARGLLDMLRGEAPQFAKIILVHDCSSDARLSPLLQAFRGEIPNAILIENDRNVGFVRTCNTGLKSSWSDVIILNTDIELPSGALGRMIDVLHSAADIATVTPFSNCAYGVGFPKLNYCNERPFCATTAQIDTAFQTVGRLEPIDIPRGVGFCMAISRHVIDKIGLFNTAFSEGYGEEADFCLRARSLGTRNVIAPNVYVYHRSGQSFGASWQEKARAGQLRLLKLHPGYVELVREYLRKGEARAANFVALVALIQNVSGQKVMVRPMSEVSTPPLKSVPLLQIERGSREVAMRLSFGQESYDFVFANAEIASDALQLAGLIQLMAERSL